MKNALKLVGYLLLFCLLGFFSGVSYILAELNAIGNWDTVQPRNYGAGFWTCMIFAVGFGLLAIYVVYRMVLSIKRMKAQNV